MQEFGHRKENPRSCAAYADLRGEQFGSLCASARNFMHCVYRGGSLLRSSDFNGAGRLDHHERKDM